MDRIINEGNESDEKAGADNVEGPIKRMSWEEVVKAL